MLSGKKDLKNLKKSIRNILLCDPSTVGHNSSHQAFFREFPWHPVYRDFDSWKSEIGYDSNSSIPNLVPIGEYDWEMNGRDQSIEDSLKIYMPAKEIIEGLNIFQDLNKTGYWIDSKQNLVFFDPSINEQGSPLALVQTQALYRWLEDNDLQLVWLIGGEKQLFTESASNFFGRLVFNGFYTLTENGIEGNDLWFNREEPGVQ